MAWKTATKYYAASQTASIFADLCSFMVTCGWTLHDTVSASDIVYCSQGESGDEPKQYVELFYDATYIRFRLFLFWDNATHTGYGGAYYSTSYSRLLVNVAGLKRFYGNADVVLSSADGQSYPMVFGHIATDKTVMDQPVATLIAGASAGSSVVLSLDNTDFFRVNSSATIIDPSTGTREDVTISAVIPGVSITISTLSYDYAIGSMIGDAPSSFSWLTTSTTSTHFYATCGVISGAGELSATYMMSVFVMGDALTPATITGLYTLPRIAVDGNTGTGFIGFLPPQLRYMSRSLGSIYIVNDSRNYDVLTATAATVSTISDSTQGWTVDEHKGKMVVCVGGTGINQSRVIESNTATQITVRDNWVITPVAGSNFLIADKTYLQIRNTLAASETPE